MNAYRKTKMISVRISEHEFERLKTASETQGARSVSDFARVVLCGSMDQPETPLNNGMHGLTAATLQLTRGIQRLIELLEGQRPLPPNGRKGAPEREQRTDFQNV